MHSQPRRGGGGDTVSEIDAFGQYLARLSTMKPYASTVITDDTILGSISYEYYTKDYSCTYEYFDGYPDEITTKKKIFYGVVNKEDSTSSYGVGLLKADYKNTYHINYNEKGDITEIEKFMEGISTNGIYQKGIPSGCVTHSWSQNDNSFILLYGGGNNPDREPIPNHMIQFKYKDLKNFKSFLDGALATLKERAQAY